MQKNSPFWYKKYKKKILGRGTAPSSDPTSLGAFGARPPVPLSDGLDTCPCKILDPPLISRLITSLTIRNTRVSLTFGLWNVFVTDPAGPVCIYLRGNFYEYIWQAVLPIIGISTRTVNDQMNTVLSINKGGNCSLNWYGSNLLKWSTTVKTLGKT